MLRSLTQAVLVAVLSLGLVAPAAAQKASAVLSRIVDSGKLRVGMSGNQPPLNFKATDGTMMGLEVDLARGLASLMDKELEIVQLPFGELLPALQKGDVDLVMSGMTITPERNMQAAFVGPYYLSGKSILTKSSTLAAAEETADLDKPELTLAALAGSTSERFVEKLMPQAKLQATKDYDEAVKLLLDDKVQAVVADQEIVLLSGYRNQAAGLVTLNQPLTIEAYGVAVPPGDALLVNFLENTLGALEVAGVLDERRAYWLQGGDWINLLP